MYWPSALETHHVPATNAHHDASHVVVLRRRTQMNTHCPMNDLVPTIPSLQRRQKTFTAFPASISMQPIEFVPERQLECA